MFYAESLKFYDVHLHVSIDLHVSIPLSTRFFLLRMDSPLVREVSPSMLPASRSNLTLFFCCPLSLLCCVGQVGGWGGWALLLLCLRLVSILCQSDFVYFAPLSLLASLTFSLCWPVCGEADFSHHALDSATMIQK